MTPCLPQETYSVYVDGELLGEELEAVESHLVDCESCRGLIFALRSEGTAIADTLLDRHLEVVSPETPARARARGLAIGLVPTLGVAALVVAALGVLMEASLPAGAGWLNPMKLVGVYEMTFDMVFMLRDRAPAFFDFVTWLGANVGGAVILIFFVRELGRRVIGTIAVLGFLLVSVGSPGAATAFELRRGEADMQVAAGETVDESLLISGETVTVDGTIEGDLAAFAERIVLRGVVHGNVFAAGREVEILGTITGSLHVAGESVRIEGKVHENAYGAAETLTLHERGDVGRDAVLVGQAVHLDGRMGRDLFSSAERVEIRGTVGRDASTRGRRLALHDGASIARNLHYELREGAEPEIAPGAAVGGEVTWKAVHEAAPVNRWLDPGFYMRVAVFLVAVFLAGVLLHWLLPDLLLADLETSSDFFRSLGYGAVALIGTPIMLVLCFVTVVGIPIGLVGVFLYLTSLFASIIVVASLVGSSITASMGLEQGGTGFGISLLVGLVVVLVGMNLPFVGGLLGLLVIVTGLGLLTDAVLSSWRRGAGDAYAG